MATDPSSSQGGQPPAAANNIQVNLGSNLGLSQNSVGSPWEDEVEVPKEPTSSEPMIVGSLDASDDLTQVPEKSSPFVVPNNPEDKLGEKIPAERYITKPDNQPLPNQAQTVPPPTKKSVDSVQPSQAEPKILSEDRPEQVVPPQVMVEPPKMADITTSSSGVPDDYLTKQLKSTLLPTESKAFSNIRGSVISRLSFFRSWVTIVILFFLLGIFLPIILTEKGVLSIGYEKVYGTIGLEKLWGGLPKNAQTALVYSALGMKEHANFKVKGQVNLTIDKSIESPIVSPLAAMNDSTLPVLASVINFSQLAVNYDDVYLNNTPSSASSNSNYNVYETQSSSSTQTGTSSTGAASPKSSLTDQSDYPSYRYQGATIKDVSADITSQFGLTGNGSTINVKKITGMYPLQVKNQAGKLWLKADSHIKYSKNAQPDEWLEYDLKPLKDKKIPSDFFNFNAQSGFSVKGKRVANEKIEDERSYHYKIDGLEIGSSLAGIGITSSMVQAVSGDVWIGVKDKLIKKLDLKITLSPSSAVTKMTVSLLFYDYDQENTFAVPDSIVKADQDKVNISVDDRRKTDLGIIQQALEDYKLDHLTYPVSSNFAKLNISGNILEKELASNYVVVLPADPKAAEGWYYAYKSDGASFTLSARLEDTADVDGQLVGDIYLYMLKNK